MGMASAQFAGESTDPLWFFLIFFLSLIVRPSPSPTSLVRRHCCGLTAPRSLMLQTFQIRSQMLLGVHTSANMSWSTVSRLPQIYKNLCHSSSRYGNGFNWNVRYVMTTCGSSTGSIGKFGWFLPSRTPCLGKSWTPLHLPRQYATHAVQEKKSKKMLLYLTGLVFAMVGCSYAAVPLYRRFCQATGYGGTVQRRESVEEKIARHAQEGTATTREIVVQFNADVADGMPWKFIPTQREVRVKPGESALAFYTAENRSSTPITGVSTYNVTPMKAAVYFNKIQCFCFEEQRLLPGEQIDMPVFFYIDPEFETDPKMDGINNLILSYTFFKVSEE
ncbi:cytochrome c oxidase assembly protein COX11, mitochondrial isoform X2 [Diospyros lotus]|uniref:cytochrome c oxidase assembly protein COX11, mitochondrial isoform X2 n=1 Tax=Diospyros lotus TaxID=55363 RepID=UPI0022515BDB|nr:cytochrome c oxidase assembly protein COX11, mitochondrial isoform X2 [Diospyros lotus]